jgi:pyruvate dehydrogenase E1 component alpha subunit
MNNEKPSPMSEAVLWRLYRRLLGLHLLNEQLPASKGKPRSAHAAIAAALIENLVEGDTLGLAPDDLATRYLCGVPLDQLRAAALPRPGRRKSANWALAADAAHGLLPCSGEAQANLAVGAALSARLHATGGVTVLFDSATARSRKPGVAGWEHAVQSAVSLQLPLLFVSGAPSPDAPGPRKPPPALPAIPVDRDDALALYRVIYESVARARTGGGPTWIECCAWPLPEAALSPLEKMEAALRSRRLFDRRHQRQIEHALEKEFANIHGQPFGD